MHPLGPENIKHACALAYASDDLPTDAVIATQAEPVSMKDLWVTSLDHAIWFHRPLSAEDWHIYDFAVHSLGANRGLALGHIFTANGVHIATVAQELLARRRREGG